MSGDSNLHDTISAAAVEQTHRSTESEPRISTTRRQCPGVNRHGQPCRSTVIGADGYCPAHSKERPNDLAAAGRKGGVASGATRRARRTGERKLADESVRSHLRKETVRRKEAITAALMRGLEADDPTVAVRSAAQLLEQSFGRPGQAAPEDDDPAMMVRSLFRRPARDGEGETWLWASLSDGRILRVVAIDDEPPDLDDAA
jgi:hypothetical protein